ncbi:hypothetical protein QBC46DRAFT_351067 [Diplogelasinospora grovesii]|uniref:Uncharacterized protein n=1 Tax=Diplogelasinospora grovesii TaxID=303347 RepID=A0AAN6NF95_9PEZI|nr:hypothetical protein QBC46DRAFT_351067 [Diplogelasinospora grovesii]
MPRQGDGSSDNAIETGHDIVHGADSDKVARADKTAPMPEHEKGAGLEGMNASGGGSQGLTRAPDEGPGAKKASN